MNNAHAQPVEKSTEVIDKKSSKEIPRIMPQKFAGDEEIPVSLYVQRFKHPYAAELLGINNKFFLGLDASLATKFDTLNEYILDHMYEMDYSDTKETYQKILENFMQEQGIKKEDSLDKKLTKLYLAIVLKRL